MPFTLAEHVVAQTNKFNKGVFLGLTQECLIGDLLTWRSTDSLTTTGIRYDGVIRPEWTPLNAPIPEKVVRGKNLSYGLYQMAVHIDIPNPLEKDNGVKERPSTRQTMLAIKGAAYELNNTFINGDQAGDPDQFEGIEKILGNMDSGQSIGASEIDVRPSANPSDTVLYSLFERLDEATDAVNGHEPDFALINRTAGQVIRSAMRRLRMSGDTFDWVKGMPFADIRQTLRTASTKPMFVYNKVPYYDIGDAVDEAGTKTAIIGNTYTEGGSSGNATRIYYVKQGEHDLEGLQFAPLKVGEPIQLHDREVQRRRLTWSVGLGAWSPDCLAVARGIRVA